MSCCFSAGADEDPKDLGVNSEPQCDSLFTPISFSGVGGLVVSAAQTLSLLLPGSSPVVVLVATASLGFFRGGLVKLLIHPLSRCALSRSKMTLRRQAGHSMYLEPEAADADADVVLARRRFLLPLVPLPLPIISAKASLPPLLRIFLDDELLMLYTCISHAMAAMSACKK